VIGRWYSIKRQWCCRPQNAQRIGTLPRRNMTRLRASVLSTVSRLRPVVAQENCMLACTRIVILRLTVEAVRSRNATFDEQRMVLINDAYSAGTPWR
jgi:hypothetical protein